jgi:hypothetical protein
VKQAGQSPVRRGQVQLAVDDFAASEQAIHLLKDRSLVRLIRDDHFTGWKLDQFHHPGIMSQKRVQCKYAQDP